MGLRHAGHRRHRDRQRRRRGLLGDVSTTHDQWEYLEAPDPSSPANEFVVHATSDGGTDFYVDDATVVAV